MVVEVTLQGPKQKSSCWFPFKKQYENRSKRIEHNGGSGWNYDYDTASLRRMDSKTINPHRPKQQLQLRNNQSHYSRTTTNSKGRGVGPGSVSTGTDASSSVGGEGHSWEGGPRTLSHLSCQTHNSLVEKTDSFRIQNNNNNNNLSSNNNVVRNAYSLDDDDDDDDSVVEMNPDGTHPYMGNHHHHHQQQKIGGDLLPVKLALVETNCMTKTFWTDEVVDGGAFACLQNKRCGGPKEPEPQVEVVHIAPSSQQQQQQRSVSFEQNFKIVEEVNDYQSQRRKKATDEHIQRILQAVGESGGIQYVSQEPEDINNNGPVLRRALCTNIRLKKQQNNKTIQKQQHPKQAGQQQQQRRGPSQISSISSSAPSSQSTCGQPKTSAEMSASSSSVESAFLNGASRGSRSNDSEGESLPPPQQPNPKSIWHQAQSKLLLSKNSGCPAPEGFNPGCGGPFFGPATSKSRFQPQDDDKTPNFYVEVEAMREQLNGIRDLEEISAEDDKMYEKNDTGITRVASLVDVDSAFMEIDDESEIFTEQARGICTVDKKGEGGKLKVLGFLKRKNTRNQSVTLKDEHEDKETGKSKGEVIMVQRRIFKCGRSELASDADRRDSQPPAPSVMDERSISDRVAERIRILNLGSDLNEEDSENKGNERSQDLNTEKKVVERRKAFSRPTTTSESSSSSSPEVVESSTRSDRQVFGGLKPTYREEEDDDFSVSHRPIVSSRSDHLGTFSEDKKEHYIGRPTSPRRPTTPVYDAYGDAGGNFPAPESPSAFQDVVASPIPKFDDNFWKVDDDDIDDIASAAFEEFNSGENDSVFGDLKSTSDSKYSKESDPSRVSYGVVGSINKNNDDDGNIREQGKNTPDHTPTRRDEQSKYTTDNYSRAGQESTKNTSADYSRADISRYTDYSRNDISRYTDADVSRYTDYTSKYSRGGETSVVSRTSHDGETTNYLDDDGEMIRYIDKWLDF